MGGGHRDVGLFLRVARHTRRICCRGRIGVVVYCCVSCLVFLIVVFVVVSFVVCRRRRVLYIVGCVLLMKCCSIVALQDRGIGIRE